MMEPDIPYFDASKFDRTSKQNPAEEPHHQFSQSLPTKVKQKELQANLTNSFAKSVEDINTPQVQAARRPGPRTRLFMDENNYDNDPEDLGIEELRSSGVEKMSAAEELNNFISGINMGKESTDRRLEAATAALARARKQQTGTAMTNSGRELPAGREDSGIHSTMMSSGNQTTRTETKPGASMNESETLKVADLFSPAHSVNGREISKPLVDVSETTMGGRDVSPSKRVTINETKNEYSYTTQTDHQSVKQLNMLKEQETFLNMSDKENVNPQCNMSNKENVNPQFNMSDKENVNPYLALDETVEGYSPDFKWNKMGDHRDPSFDLGSLPSVETTPVIGQTQAHRADAGAIPKMQPLTEELFSTPSANTSQTGDDISSVERLRLYLQNMLQNTANNIPDKSQYDQSDPVGQLMVEQMFPDLSADLSTTFSSGVSYARDKSVADIPAYQEALDLATHGQRQNRPVHASASILAENQALREKLEKQTYRRKHCEHQVKQLHEKILELQQQLAVAISTERRKDMVIEQLNQVLGNAVNNWKKEQTNKQQKIHQLHQERTEIRSEFKKIQQILEESQQNLKQKTLSLSNEKQRAAQAEADHRALLNRYEESSKHVNMQYQEEKQQNHVLKMENDKLTREKGRLKSQLEEVHNSHAEEKDNWDEKESDYLQKIDDMSTNHLKLMQEEKNKLSTKEQMLKDTEKALRDIQREMKEVEMKLDMSQREKESLKVEAGLREAKYESGLRKLDADLKAEMERQLAEKAEDAHQRQTEGEARLREQHRKQIFELNQRHSVEMEEQLQQYHDDLRRKDHSLKEQIDVYEQRLQENRAEIDGLKNENKRLESYRLDITNKLQGMMQSLCSESFQLLKVGTADVTHPGQNSMISSMTTLQERRTTSPTVQIVTQHNTSTAHVSTTSVLNSVPLSSISHNQSGFAAQSSLPGYNHSSVANSFDSHYFQGTGLNTAHTLNMGLPMQTNSAFHPVGSQQTGSNLQSHPITTQQIRPSLPPNNVQPDWLSQGYVPNPIPDMTAIRARLNAIAQIPPEQSLQNNSTLSSQSNQEHHLTTQNVVLFNKDPRITIHEPTFIMEEQHGNKLPVAALEQHFQPLSHDDSLISESDFKSHRMSVSTRIGEHDAPTFRSGQAEDQKQDHTRLSNEDNVDYSQLSNKVEDHEERQRELQHYLRMILNRSPGDPLHDPDDQNHSGSSAAPTGGQQAFIREHIHGISDDAVNGRSTPNAPTSKIGVLSPQQVSEISRLLQSYKVAESGQGQDPPVEELLSYLKDSPAQATPEKPTRDPGVHGDHTAQPRAKRNLGITFQKKQENLKPNTETSQIVGKSDHQKRSSAALQQQVKKPATGQSSAGKPGQQKKPERKMAVVGTKAPQKGSAPAWK